MKRLSSAYIVLAFRQTRGLEEAMGEPIGRKYELGGRKYEVGGRNYEVGGRK